MEEFRPGVASDEVNTAAGHPLEPAIELARSVQSNIEANIRDYTATVVKQERSWQRVEAGGNLLRQSAK